MSKIFAWLGAAFYTIWGVFHVYVAWQIYTLGASEQGLAQGRLFQMAAYMLCIALFAIGIALTRNWRNDRLGYWLNLAVVSWADGVWVLVVVLPGYVPIARGLIPPAFWVTAAIFSTLAYRLQHTASTSQPDRPAYAPRGSAVPFPAGEAPAEPAPYAVKPRSNASADRVRGTRPKAPAGEYNPG